MYTYVYLVYRSVYQYVYESNIQHNTFNDFKMLINLLILQV